MWICYRYRALSLDIDIQIPLAGEGAPLSPGPHPVGAHPRPVCNSNETRDGKETDTSQRRPHTDGLHPAHG